MNAKLFLAAICFTALLSKNIQSMEVPATKPAVVDPYAALPPDIQKIAREYLLTGTPSEIGATVRKMAKLNIDLAREVNSQENTMNLMEFLSVTKGIDMEDVEDAAIALGTAGAEKWLAKHIKDIRIWANDDLTRITLRLLIEKEKIGAGSRYFALAARALRAFNPAPNGRPTALLPIAEAATRLHAEELYPILVDKIKQMPRAFSIRENRQEACAALWILADIEEAIPTTEPLAQELAAYFEELKNKGVSMDVSKTKNFSEAANICNSALGQRKTKEKLT